MEKIKGINLGGWLVIEKWITPSLFAGTPAEDEYSLSLTVGAKAKIEAHREQFITAADFKWIAKQGFNAVRLPVGYWLFEEASPFISGSNWVNFALEQAAQNDLKLLLDLHGVPGSQNGNDHSGRAGDVGWHSKPEYLDRTLATLSRICQLYGNNQALVGIEVLNEPDRSIPHQLLEDFYLASYHLIRQETGSRLEIVLADAWRPLDWTNLFIKQLTSIYLDTHLYQVFSHRDRAMSLKGHIKKTQSWAKLIGQLNEHGPVIVGEWSGALDPNTRGLQSEAQVTTYIQAQIKAFGAAAGWYYWTYKTEAAGSWNLRHLIESEIFPVDAL